MRTFIAFLLLCSTAYAGQGFVPGAAFPGSINLVGGACTPGNERLYPNSHPATTANMSSTGCAAGSHHECLDDTYGAEDDATTYLTADYGAHDEDSFGLTDTSVMTTDCSTSTIVVTVRGYGEQAPTYAGPITATLNIAGGTETSSEGAQALPHTWTNLTYTFTGTWTKAQVDAATVRIQDAGDSGSNNEWITAMSALVNYE